MDAPSQLQIRAAAKPVVTPSGGGGAADPERWVEQHADALYQYALLRLRNPQKAEDAVQETYLAALRGANRFEGRSAERTWLVGILRNKIFDQYRTIGRETSFTDLGFYGDEERDRFLPDGVFAGGWIHELGPVEWKDPAAHCDRAPFWETFRSCTMKLPHKVAAVFTMREVDGVDSKEICDILNISENNLWVMLHRARMALRRCLETHWFTKPS